MSVAMQKVESEVTWHTVKLGDVLTLINGRAYKKEEERDAGTPVLRIQNLNGGNRWFYSELSLPHDKYCEKGDLLFAWSATFGPYIWWGEKVIYHYHIWKIECGPDLDKKFAYYLLQHITEKVKAAGRGISMIHMTKGGMEAWEVSIPPLDEQKRIAAILDQADELRRKRQRAIDRLNQLGQAIFHEMFGSIDEEDAVPFGDVVFFQEGPGVRNWQFRDEGVKLINVKNIVNGRLETRNTNRYLEPSEAYGKYKHFLLVEGDYVLASSGVTWGKIAEVTPFDLPLCLNTSMIRLRPNGQTVTKEYLRGFVEMGSFRTQIDRLITGSAQPNFGPSHLKQVKIPVPDIVDQNRFVERIFEFRKSAVQEGVQHESLGRLFTALQHRAFRGEL